MISANGSSGTAGSGLHVAHHVAHARDSADACDCRRECRLAGTGVAADQDPRRLVGCFQGRLDLGELIIETHDRRGVQNRSTPGRRADDQRRVVVQDPALEVAEPVSTFEPDLGEVSPGGRQDVQRFSSRATRRRSPRRAAAIAAPGMARPGAPG